MSVAPIRLRHGILPLIAHPRGGGLVQAFSIATGYDLAAIDSFRVGISPRSSTSSLEWIGSVSAPDAFTARVFTLDFTDDAASDEDDAITLADVAALGACVWDVDALDEAGVLLWRLQGDLRFTAERGSDGGLSASPGDVIGIDLGGETVISVTILGNAASAAVDNAAVVAAIEEDPAAVRTAAGLGTAATADADDFEAVGAAEALAGTLGDSATRDVGTTAGTVAAGDHTHGQLHDAATVSGNGIAITGQQISLSIGTGATQVAAGNHTHSYGDASGPASSTDNAIARFDGTNGKLLQNSTAKIDDLGNFQCNSYDGRGGSGVKIDYWSSGNITLPGTTQGINWQGGAAVWSGSTYIEINAGAAGTYRDLILRDLIATQFLRPASYTVAAANALVSPPDGAVIHVSNEAGGAVDAYRARSAWRRFYDDAAIS